MSQSNISPSEPKPKKPRKAATVPPAQAVPPTPIDAAATAVELWAIDRIAPNPKNARKHSAKQIEQLRQSFERFGQVWPILVDRDGMIIAGHGRFEAAKAAHLKSVNVIVAEGWTPEQCRAYALLDNKIALNSEWDDDMLGAEISELKHSGIDIGLLGFTSKELARLMPSADGPPDGSAQLGGLKYAVIIRCKDEDHQGELLEKLEKEGLSCEALIS